jgi:arylsulfatase A-like enzyme
MRDAGLSWRQIKQVYNANLRRALESVEELIESLDGKVVITADHGEMLGEKGLYSHPHGVYFKELVEVPWFVVDE